MKKAILNKKGETLVEVLAAILIFTLSSIILYSMITTASGINMKAQQKDKAVQFQTGIAEHADGKKKTGEKRLAGKFYLTFIENGKALPEPSEKIITIFKGETDDSLYSYHEAEPTEHQE